MSVAMQCSRCGRPMHSSGLSGLCPLCLYASTADRLDAPVAEVPASDGESWVAGSTVGPDDRFVLLDRLGAGGMGEVWLATDQALSQEGEPHFVALKFLSKAIQHEARALADVRAEVLRSQKLSHPNIVRIFDLHHTRQGLPFIKMEYVEGNSLSKWLEEEPQHIMPWKLVAQLTEQLAGALLYAHETVGLVHRDLKPSNLLLAEGPVVKLSDFGISCLTRDRSRQRSEEMALGTIWYSSPQQLLGQPPDPADDIYALGATVYELLTGTPPFEDSDFDTLSRRIQFHTPETIPQRLARLGRANEVPNRLQLLVQSCLEKDPAYRPKTRELTRFLPAVSVSSLAPQLSVPTPANWESPPEPAKSRGWAWLWLPCMVLLVALAWWQNWGDIQNRFAKLNSLVSGRPAGSVTHATNTPAAPVPETAGPSPTNVASEPPKQTPSPSPVAPPQFGYISIDIQPSDLKDTSRRDTKMRHRYWIQDGGGHVVKEGLLPAGVVRFQSDELKPGAYKLRVSEGRDGTGWTMEDVVQVQAGETCSCPFWFAKNEELTITSTPSDAWVWWPSGLSAISMATNARTPFTHRFKSGRIPFTVKKPGHYELPVQYNFNPVVTQSLHLTLVRSLHPLPGEHWTNSLGMVFLWVDPVSNWVCITETRVGDFRRFTDATAHDTAPGMLSLTATGYVQSGSWRAPVFSQTEEHPVVGVNWEDANRFCVWLTEAEHQGNTLAMNQSYRLLQTNEWFAIAGGRRFPWGEDVKRLAGNYSGQEVLGGDWPAAWSVLTHHRDDYPRTAPVISAAFPPNALGFYHVGGNAAEWCQEKVLCGASWRDGEESDLHSLFTTNVVPRNPSERRDQNGFRIMIFQAD